jgi:hypothetical protein
VIECDFAATLTRQKNILQPPVWGYNAHHKAKGESLGAAVKEIQE